MKLPSRGSLLFGLIPFCATWFSVTLWDRVDPMVLGLPFNFFWLLLWFLLTPLCLWAAYSCESHARDERGPGGRP